MENIIAPIVLTVCAVMLLGIVVLAVEYICRESVKNTKITAVLRQRGVSSTRRPFQRIADNRKVLKTSLQSYFEVQRGYLETR